MKKKSLVILTTIILGILICSLVVVLVIKYKTNNTPSANTPNYEYTKIEIKSLDKSTSYGFLWVENNLVKNNIEISEISTYVLSNSSKWQRESLEYPTGGYENGTFWDGTQTTDITKNDFLIAIYVSLDDTFGKSYYIDLIK